MAESLSSRTKLWWVAFLYFAEGFPFGLLFDAFPIYFRTHGLSLTQIGLLSLAGLPWTLKFLWAPVVDRWGTYRSWIVGCQVLLAVDIVVLLLLGSGQVDGMLWGGLIALSVAAATQDIAIDAYTIQLLDEVELGPANGVRVAAYRVALIFAGGLFVALAGLLGWQVAFATAGLLFAVTALVTSRAPLPRLGRMSSERLGSPTNIRSRSRTQKRESIAHRFRGSRFVQAYIGPLHGFWQRPGVVYVLLFVLLFKVGDMALGPMVRPFWVDRQFTPLQIGAVPGTIGVLTTIAGALLGGRLTKSWGLFRALWVLGILQAASNLGYAYASAMPRSAALMYGASVVESFCGGLGTAPFLAFLMHICEKRTAATQYALLSALFGLSRSLAGALSGVIAETTGYTVYFTATFFLAWPAFALLPWVRQWIGSDHGSS